MKKELLSTVTRTVEASIHMYTGSQNPIDLPILGSLMVVVIIVVGTGAVIEKRAVEHCDTNS